MTRDECEKAIAEKLEEIRSILLEYCPDETYLALFIRKIEKGWRFEFNNPYWRKDTLPINYVKWENEDEQ